VKLPKNLNPNVAPQTVSVYTRHSPKCPKRGSTAEQKTAAKYEKRCNCAKWIYLFHDGSDYRFSAATRSWDKAEEKKRQIEDSLDPVKAELKRLKTQQQSQRKPLSDAVEEFLSDAKKRNLAPETCAKLQTMFKKQLLLWTKQNGIGYLDELRTAHLTRWRSTWFHSPLTSRGRQETLRGFFRFCIQQEWLEKNPACGLSRIKVKSKPTGYFPPEEFETLVRATYSYAKGSNNPNAENCAIRIRTLLLLMRCSGLRTGDAVALERSRLVGNNIFLYQAKTGEPVYVPLPPEVANALRQVPPGVKPNPRYFFWNGSCTVRSATSVWQNAFRRLFRIADIRKPDGTPKRCHLHMLRDTFAVEMLLAGVLLEKVSVLLGHASTKATEKHYKPWVRARQQDLEDTVNKAWLVQRIPGITPPSPAESIGHDKGNGMLMEPQRLTSNANSSPHFPAISVVGHVASSELTHAKLPCRNADANQQSVSGGTKLNGNSLLTKKYRRFPYIAVAKMWNEGKTIKEIAVAIDRLDAGIDPSHSLRGFLTRMHRIGYKNEHGERVKLPYRVRTEHEIRSPECVRPDIPIAAD
jgi:integrase/recombinase XerD